MKRLFLACLVVAILVLLMIGCDQLGGDLVISLDKAKKEIRELQDEVSTLRSKVHWMELEKELDTVVLLKPSNDGYSILKLDIGSITVKLQDVKQYANGSKVTLRFGNPSSARIFGLKATVQWGKVGPKGNAIFEDNKSRKIEFIKDLNAGAWTQIDVVLEGIPPADLGFVRISELEHKGISLIGSR